MRQTSSFHHPLKFFNKLLFLRSVYTAPLHDAVKPLLSIDFCVCLCMRVCVCVTVSGHLVHIQPPVINIIIHVQQ